MPTGKGSIHLFRFGGIDVYLHWSWFVVAFFQVSYRSQFPHGYTSISWCVYEYLALFLIVLLHEFGHSLACRSVGGRADQIVLWPLGGVAFVDPPPRPGATLWSLAAGPLVNVLLIPILGTIWFAARALNWPETNPNLNNFITMICFINAALLAFNLLPIYPLDGGQILRSLLWFFLGRARSLMVASGIGLVAVVLLMIFAIRDMWLTVMAAFALLNCWSGLQQARMLARITVAPRRAGVACPKCKTPPPVGSFWGCGRCRTNFDMFATRGVCPNCGTIFNATRCLECGEPLPLYAFGETN
ncbi:MAG: site-2 protease family protein [Verrucomicrobiota bacterium]|jgi:Zn-dependent protease